MSQTLLACLLAFIQLFFKKNVLFVLDTVLNEMNKIDEHFIIYHKC